MRVCNSCTTTINTPVASAPDLLGVCEQSVAVPLASDVPTANESVVIGITGCSGTGWLSKELLQAVEAVGKKAQIVGQDNFWLQTREVNVGGQMRTSEVEPECTDHIKLAAAVSETKSANDIVIVEGTQVVHHKQVRAKLGHIFLIDADKDEARRHWTADRQEDFEDLVWPAHERYMKDKISLCAGVVNMKKPTSIAEKDELVHCMMQTVGLVQAPRSMTPSLETLENTRVQSLLADLSRHRKDFADALARDHILDAATSAGRILAQRERLAAITDLSEAESQEVDAAQDILAQLVAEKASFEAILEEERTVNNWLGDFISEDGWKSTSNSGGIKTWFRNRENSHCIDTKLEIELPIPNELREDPTALFLRIVALLNETDLMPAWYAPKGLMKSSKVVARPRLLQSVVHSKLEFPWFLPISKRELFVLGTGYDISRPDLDATIITFRAVSSTDAKDTAALPGVDLTPTPGFVEIWTSGAYYIESKSNGDSPTGMLFRFVQSADLRLAHVPPALVNLAAKAKIPRELVGNIQAVLADFSGSEWDERLKADTYGMYDEVGRRLRERHAEKMSKKSMSVASARPELSGAGALGVTECQLPEVRGSDVSTASASSALSALSATTSANSPHVGQRFEHTKVQRSAGATETRSKSCTSGSKLKSASTAANVALVASVPVILLLNSGVTVHDLRNRIKSVLQFLWRAATRRALRIREHETLQLLWRAATRRVSPIS
jgi:uridine kinase